MLSNIGRKIYNITVTDHDPVESARRHRLGGEVARSELRTSESSPSAAFAEATLTLSLTLSLTLATLTTLTTLTALAILTVLTVVLTVVLTILTILAVVSAIVAAVVVASVVSSVVSDLEPDTVILGSTLGNRHQHRLMVGSRCHRADTVEAFRKAIVQVSTEQPLAVAVVVDTLEERKFLSIERLAGVEVATKILHCDVGVANDCASLKGLGSRVVGVIRVRKLSSLQVGDLH